MKLFFPLLISFQLFTSFVQSQPYDANHKYPVVELQDDFRCLRDSLEKIHPNLYMYTTKPVFDAFFDSLYNSLRQPLTDIEFYNIITLLNGKVKNGHTMFLPGDAATAYLNKLKFLPFYVIIINGRLYVNMNCTAGNSLHDGDEILSINGKKSTDILNYLLSRQIHDGYNTTYPVWILNNYFKEYYGFSFGHPDSFYITYKSNHAQTQKTVIGALPKDSIKYYRSVRYATRFTADLTGKGITLQLNKVQGYAVLTIKDFADESLQSIYKQKFEPTLNSIFKQIREDNVRNLILDLRDNQGGDFENGQLLLSYLLGKPFKLLEKGDATQVVQPLKNRFAGELYTLINGGSFSNTAIVCSRLAYYKRGVFIGEETGGNNTIISGFADDENTIQLPNTKTNCAVSTTSFLIRANTVNKGHGTMPDYHVAPSVKDIVLNNDVVKKYAIALATKK